MGRKKPQIEIVLSLGIPILTFPILSRRKALDEKGYVYELPDGKRYIVLTSGGEHYVSRPGELLQKIREYESAIDETETALRLFYADEIRTDIH